MNLRQDSERIIRHAIGSVMPGEAVKRILTGMKHPKGKLLIVAIGKAAWTMSSAALELLGERVDGGCVITKYGHSQGALSPLMIFEAGHPVPDENSYRATEAVLELTHDLTEDDMVLFLVSGGGSALFELPRISAGEMEKINQQLLASGADITEINTIRKRLSQVKGGRFGLHCAPAKVVSILLSDVLGDRLDMIASGPAAPDSSKGDALHIAARYGLQLSIEAIDCLRQPLPDTLPNVENHISGSVRQLCQAAEEAAKALGYETVFLTDALQCEAKQAGAFLGAVARSHQSTTKSLAFICGGETVVHVHGSGRGGRNQELALAAAPYLSQCTDTLLFSVGSDGTDGPTDAAGGIVDENTQHLLQKRNFTVENLLENNDAYNGLKAANGLVFTGPTGTNVNDFSVLLIRR